MKNDERKMKYSGIEWVGKIPNDWNKIYGQYLYDIVTGKKDVNQGDLDGQYPFFTCSDDVKRINEYSFDCEALLVAGNGIVGNTKYYNGKFDAYQRTYVLYNFKKERINIEFLKIYLSNLLTISVEAKTSGSVIEFIKLGDIKKFEIVYPDINRQERIAELLNKKIHNINSLIMNEEQQIEKLREYKQSLITEVVTKGLNKNIEMKDSGVEWIGKIPKHTKISKVKYFYDVTLGKMVQPNKIREDDTYEKYLCAVNVGDNVLKYDTVKEMWISNKDKMNYKVAKGDLIVVEGGDVGSCAIYDADFKDLYFQNALHRVRSNKYSVEFLRYWLIFAKSKKYFDVICNKATIAHFTKEKFDNLLLIVYDVEEQNNIVKYLDNICLKIDKLTEIKYKKIEKLNEYKKSLIYEYVTGKKEV